MRVEAIKGQTALRCSKNTKRNKALQSLKRRSVGGVTFTKINSITHRVDSPKKQGAGWLAEVAWPGSKHQRWVARIGHSASQPLTLDEAKRAAVAMLGERGPAEDRDWIADLNKIATSAVDRVALARERKRWPFDLVGATHTRSRRVEISAELCKAVLDAELGCAVKDLDEPLGGDGFQLEFSDDAYPKLPECLRRKGAKEGRSA
jgi:hypothetical protein